MQPFRLTSFFILILLLGAVVAVACTNDDGASTAVETPPPSTPTPDVEAIVETAVRETLRGMPTPAPPPDIEAIVEVVLQQTMDTLLEALFTIRSLDTEVTEDAEPSPEPISVPEPGGQVFEVQAVPASASLTYIAQGFSALHIAQEVSESGGLTVTANGSVTVSADEAYVIVIPDRFYDPGGPGKLSHEDRDDVVQNLMDIGIGEDDIEFESGQQYEPETISVEVLIADLPEIGDLILDAVEDVIRRSERSGVRFSVSGQSCDQALAAARQEAIMQAEGDSLDLAEVLGLVRGGIIAVVENPANSFGPGLPSLDKCGGGQFHPYLSPLMLFDADPEVEVSLRMRITYGPESELTGGLTATANGSMIVSADEAYVVIIHEQFYGPGGPEKLSSEDRDDVVQNLMDIGIGEDDIEFESGRQYEPETISVEVQIEDLPEIGDLILNAVEDVLRRSEHSGVRFTLSEENCDRALGLARLGAISQIDRKADDMAAALGMVRGGVVGAVEDPLSNLGYRPASTDRCGGLSQDPYALLSFDAEPSLDIVLPLQITYAPQSDETAGFVAVASGSQTVTADEAYVVVIPQRFYGPRGPEPLSMEDRADVIDKLAEIGIASDDIEIVSGRRPYEPVQISVEVAVADLPEIGERILDSVEEVLRRSENSGVRFGLSEERCNAGLALARRDAASQADKDADGLAEAIGVVRGGVVSVAEYSLGGFNYSSTSTATCDGQFQDHNALLPFDAEPKIEVAVQIRIGYAISR